MKMFELLANPAWLALLVVALRVLYAVISRVVAPYPRARAAVEAVAALGPDVLRAVQQGASAATGRPAPTLDLRAPDDDRAALKARAEAAERRVAELAGAAPPAAPVERATSVPPVVIGVLFVLAVACGPARAALMSATPGVPPLASGVDAGVQRCNGAVPEVCVASGDGVRCWPSLQRDPRGHQRACLAGCAIDDAGVAVCLPGDVGNLDDDASEVLP